MQPGVQYSESADGQSAVNSTCLVLPSRLCGDVVALYLSLGVQRQTRSVAKCVQAFKIPVEVVETHVAENKAGSLKHILPVLPGAYSGVGESVLTADLVGSSRGFLPDPGVRDQLAVKQRAVDEDMPVFETVTVVSMLMLIGYPLHPGIIILTQSHLFRHQVVHEQLHEPFRLVRSGDLLTVLLRQCHHDVEERVPDRRADALHVGHLLNDLPAVVTIDVLTRSLGGNLHAVDNFVLIILSLGHAIADALSGCNHKAQSLVC